jgi:hypothetical protein
MGKEHMNKRIETYASDEWIQTCTLVRETDEEDESCRAAALEIAAATSSLCGDWLLPLAVHVRVESRNPEDYYFADDEHPPAFSHWSLRPTVWDERLHYSPFWIDSQERRVASIGATALLAFVEEAVGQPPQVVPREIALAELSISALGVALPEGLELEPLYRRIPVVPIIEIHERRSLVIGPKSLTAGGLPMSLRATNKYGSMRLNLELLWDFWIEHPAGQAQVRAAIDRVLARGRGWQVEKGLRP